MCVAGNVSPTAGHGWCTKDPEASPEGSASPPSFVLLPLSPSSFISFMPFFFSPLCDALYSSVLVPFHPDPLYFSLLRLFSLPPSFPPKARSSAAFDSLMTSSVKSLCTGCTSPPSETSTPISRLCELRVHGGRPRPAGV